MKKCLLFLLLLTSTAPAVAQSADDDGDGIANADDRCPAIAGPATNHGCPVEGRPASPRPAGAVGTAPQSAAAKEAADQARFQKELTELVNALPDAALTGRPTPAPAAGSPASASSKPSAAEKRAAREAADRKLTEQILGELMDAGFRAELERYKDGPADPLPVAGGTTPSWHTRLQIPDADETMCFYKTNGTFIILGLFRDEPAAAAARREAALAAVLESLIARKGGTLTTDSNGSVVYLFGKGAMYLDRQATENAGEEAVTLHVQHLD